MSETDLTEAFQSLMAFEITNAVPIADASDQIARLIDLSATLGSPEGAKRGIELAQQCLDRNAGPAEAALLHYFAANAWSDLQAMSRQGADSIVDWEQPEIEKQLIHLRRALSSDGFHALPEVRRCQIATNYGNLFSKSAGLLRRLKTGIKPWASTRTSRWR